MNKLFLKIAVAFLLVIGANSELFAQVIIPTDINGRRLKTKNYVEMNGSPYLFKDWAKGTVKFTKGAVYEGMIKYDQISDELSYIDSNNEPLEFVDPVFEFSIEDPKGNADTKRRVFKKGFGSSPLDNESNNLFFEILVDGNVLLLKRTQKTIIEQTPYNSATPVQHVKEIITYYTSEKGNLVKLKKPEKDLVENLNIKTSELEKYIKEKKMNLKKEDDLKEVVAYYNSIK
jgi:hypothetical protein